MSGRITVPAHQIPSSVETMGAVDGNQTWMEASCVIHTCNSTRLGRKPFNSVAAGWFS